MNVMKSFDLTGKTAVITGGAGLYGYQMVCALAEAGATVYVASRNKKNNLEKLDKLCLNVPLNICRRIQMH